jgi:hypothetical protein
MRLYRKKPVVVEAMRWTGDNNAEVMEWCGTHREDHEEQLVFVPLAHPKPLLWVAANQAYIPIECGDWIIRDALGFYPCKNEMFEATYDLQGNPHA